MQSKHVRAHHPRATRYPRKTHMTRIAILPALATLALAGSLAAASPAEDKAAVAALDTQYQAAVKANDAATMDRILADDFILVTGKGKVFGKADLLQAARDQTEAYEHQEDSQQTVRVWGDTAVVTALLWVKGTHKEGAFDYKLWFSDTYARTPTGWRYVFGQASTRMEP
jgi:ketosteroid isomerase-like protein